MIVLYAIGLALLGVAAFVTARRARNLEGKYVSAAKEAERLAQQLTIKNGNRNQLDACTAARNQYELGRVVQKRDRAETKYTAWAARAEGLVRVRARLHNWKGRTAPYVFGIVDAALVMAGLTWIGAMHLDSCEVIEKIRAVVTR
jgi:hypothetical protein